jgi:hypothetical protein
MNTIINNSWKLYLRVYTGSCFLEGLEQRELSEPLQFSVSTELAEHLPIAVARVRDLIAQVAAELQTTFG